MSKVKTCYKCERELVNAYGIHLGVPFAHWTAYKLMSPKIPFRILVCSKCYDEITVKENVAI